MKDLFQNYHKHKVLSNLGLLSISAILAISINSFVLTGNIGDSIKASVLEIGSQNTGDLDMEVIIENNVLTFQNNKEIQAVKSISFSLAYNPEVLKILPSKNPALSVSEETLGFTRYTLSFNQAKDFHPKNALLQLNLERLTEEAAYLNIVNVEFSDEENNSYRLSTSNIVF